MDAVCFTDQDVKPWAPFAPMIQHITTVSRGSERILDVGAGNNPFPPATHIADLFPRTFAAMRSVQVNFRTRELPFDDKYFDFVYCRHTFEDMDDPSRLIAEIQRVGRRGYVETPSPLSEVCRGIDGGSPVWRGYSHHRHMIWAEAGKLFVLPKLAQIEHVRLADATNVSTLKREPALANTYFVWSGAFETRYVWDDLLTAFEAGRPVSSYENLVKDAVSKGIDASRAMLKTATNSG